MSRSLASPLSQSDMFLSQSPKKSQESSTPPKKTKSSRADMDSLSPLDDEVIPATQNVASSLRRKLNQPNLSERKARLTMKVSQDSTESDSSVTSESDENSTIRFDSKVGDPNIKSEVKKIVSPQKRHLNEMIPLKSEPDETKSKGGLSPLIQLKDLKTKNRGSSQSSDSDENADSKQSSSPLGPNANQDKTLSREHENVYGSEESIHLHNPQMVSGTDDSDSDHSTGNQQQKSQSLKASPRSKSNIDVEEKSVAVNNTAPPTSASKRYSCVLGSQGTISRFNAVNGPLKSSSKSSHQSILDQCGDALTLREKDDTFKLAVSSDSSKNMGKREASSDDFSSKTSKLFKPSVDSSSESSDDSRDEIELNRPPTGEFNSSPTKIQIPPAGPNYNENIGSSRPENQANRLEVTKFEKHPISSSSESSDDEPAKKHENNHSPTTMKKTVSHPFNSTTYPGVADTSFPGNDVSIIRRMSVLPGDSPVAKSNSPAAKSSPKAEYLQSTVDFVKPKAVQGPLHDYESLQENLLQKGYTDLKEQFDFTSAEGLFEEDLLGDEIELYIIQCPIQVDPSALIGRKIDLSARETVLKLPSQGKKVPFDVYCDLSDSECSMSVITPSRKKKRFTLNTVPLKGHLTITDAVDLPNIEEKSDAKTPPKNILHSLGLIAAQEQSPIEKERNLENEQNVDGITATQEKSTRKKKKDRENEQNLDGLIATLEESPRKNKRASHENDQNLDGPIATLKESPRKNKRTSHENDQNLDGLNATLEESPRKNKRTSHENDQNLDGLNATLEESPRKNKRTSHENDQTVDGLIATPEESPRKKRKKKRKPHENDQNLDEITVTKEESTIKNEKDDENEKNPDAEPVDTTEVSVRKKKKKKKKKYNQEHEEVQDDTVSLEAQHTTTDSVVVPKTEGLSEAFDTLTSLEPIGTPEGSIRKKKKKKKLDQDHNEALDVLINLTSMSSAQSNEEISPKKKKKKKTHEDTGLVPEPEEQEIVPRKKKKKKEKRLKEEEED